VIEKGDERVLDALAQRVFSKPHANNMLILKQAITIENKKERIAFMNEKLGPASKVYNQEVVATGSTKTASAPKPAIKITPNLKLKDIVLIHKQPYEVLENIGQGRRGVIFKIKDSKNQFFTLKVAKNNEPETLASIAKEEEKAKSWSGAGLRHSKIFVLKENFVLKEFIDGTPGDILVDEFLAGKTEHQPAMYKIFAIVENLMKKGIYAGDFRPANLIFNGSEWVIIDGGSLQNGLSFEEAREKWQKKFEKRWKQKLICEDLLNAS
jgi:predicted Ser/Thr protein kinase